MPVDAQPVNDREQRFQEAILAYLKAADSGLPLGQDELRRRYPDLDAELATFFADQSALEPRLAPLRELHATCVPASADGLRPFGDYEALREIGRGGMGVVYRARQKSLNRLVALKVIRAGVLASEEDRRRYRNEAEAAALLDHPGIVPVYEVREHEGQPYFSMKLLTGGSLAALVGQAASLSSDGRLAAHPTKGATNDPRLAANFVATVARAVHYAHQHGILHCDLKPSNILLDAGARPHLTDFGLARRVGGPDTLTQTGVFVGTPSYMAPEQAAGRPGAVTTATDVYGLGAVLYTLLCGRPPFEGATALATLEQVRTRQPDRPSGSNPRIDRDLETITLKCLAKEPGRRYPSAEAVADDLERWLSGQPILARRVGRRERVWLWCRRNPAVAVLAATTAAVVLAAVPTLAISLALVNREREKTAHALDRAVWVGVRGSLDQCKYGDLTVGLLGLAQALGSTTEDDADLQRAVRLNLAAWSSQLRRIHLVLTHDPRPGADAMILAVAYSPQGDLLATAGHDGTARLWDARTGEERGVFPHGHEHVNCVAFSPDGRMLATAAQDGKVRLWKVATTARIGKDLPYPQPVLGVAFSPDGKRLVATGSSGPKLWAVEHPASPVLVAELPNHGGMMGVAMSQGGVFVAGQVMGSDAVQLRQAATGAVIGKPLRGVRALQTAAFSPDGRLLATAGGNGTVDLWKLPEGEHRRSLPHPALVHGLAFSSDGRKLLTGCQDTVARLWALDAGGNQPEQIPLASSVYGVAFTPDGKSFAATGGVGSGVVVWDMDQPRAAPIRTSHLISTVCYSPNGRLLLTGGANLGALIKSQVYKCDVGEAQLWDVATGSPVGKPMWRQEAVFRAVFSPQGGQVLLGSIHPLLEEPASGDASLWEVGSGTVVRTHRSGPGHGVLAVAFSPDGTRYVTGDRGKEVQLWDTASGKLLWKRKRAHELGVRAVAYGPTGRTLVTGSDDKTAQLWDADTGERIGDPMAHPAQVASLALDATGRFLLTGCHDKLARVWDLETRRQVGPTYAHGGPVIAVAWSADGNLLATGGMDGTARFWDRATGLPVGPVMRHDEGRWEKLNLIPAVAFSPDGRRLATGGMDMKVWFWDVPGPVEGSADRLLLWTEVITGHALAADGSLRTLGAVEWWDCRRQLDRLGGAP
jgi:WD40 repeat protein/tRNA A-37 threonylcarbamoyl transferase component Bud32